MTDQAKEAATQPWGYTSISIPMREIYAGLAMQALITQPLTLQKPTELAKDAVMYADALIAELQKKGE